MKENVDNIELKMTLIRLLIEGHVTKEEFISLYEKTSPPREMKVPERGSCWEIDPIEKYPRWTGPYWHGIIDPLTNEHIGPTYTTTS